MVLVLKKPKKINKSISSLGNCINLLANNSNIQHVPFRDSKLTRILTECLGGNSKTCICACISPYLMNFDETITTLQFASRAMKIKVNPHIFEKIDVKQAAAGSNKGLPTPLHGIDDEPQDDTYKVLGKRVGSTERKIDVRKILSGQDEAQQSQRKPRKSPSAIGAADEETINMIKKFQFMIVHLQNELAKKTIIINNLLEENKKLKGSR